MPKLYLGTMTFGWSQSSSVVSSSVANKMMELFVSFQRRRRGIERISIDTARIYAGGETESIVGKGIYLLIDPSHDLGGISSSTCIHIGTKAHPSEPLGLSDEGIRQQLESSLKSLNLSSVSNHVILDEYYLHQPDTERPLLDSLITMDSLVKQGKIKQIGMSNYHALEMKRAFDLCEKYNLTKPSVYQGIYNPLNRMVEQDLIPLLRSNHCSFVAYNPLAAGLLTGKHSLTSPIKDGRFKNNPNYLSRFYTPANFQGLKVIQDACDKEGLTLIEATFRWLLFHSSLDSSQDGILIGASSESQLDQNLNAIESSLMESKDSSPPKSCRLSPALLKAFDDAWEIVQTNNEVFSYWRSFSSDMPDRDSMSSGASYQVGAMNSMKDIKSSV